MSDPLLRFIFQPVVDTLRLDPRAEGRRNSDLFVLFAITLAAMRIVTGQPNPVPWENTLQVVMLVIGVGILWPFIRFFASNGPVAVNGEFGAIHFGMRMMFLGITVIDIVTICMMLAAEPGEYKGIAVMRQTMQMLEEGTALTALYLAMCMPPPPPREIRKLARI